VTRSEQPLCGRFELDRGTRSPLTDAVVVLAVCCLALSLGVGAGAGHLRHQHSTPTEPLEPTEVPWWFRPLVGGLGGAVAAGAALATNRGRTSRLVGAASVCIGVLLVAIAVAAQPQWF
jgi:hypothetical protein